MSRALAAAHANAQTRPCFPARDHACDRVWLLHALESSRLPPCSPLFLLIDLSIDRQKLKPRIPFPSSFMLFLLLTLHASSRPFPKIPVAP
jgi:hypothetical protein